MRQTSLEAYESVKFELGLRQRVVYEAIDNLFQPNNREIAEEVGFKDWKNYNLVEIKMTEVFKFYIITITCKYMTYTESGHYVGPAKSEMMIYNDIIEKACRNRGFKEKETTVVFYYLRDEVKK